MKMKKPTKIDFALIEACRDELARRDFHYYRQRIHPTFNLSGWYQRDLSANLQQFFVDWEAGKRPRILLTAPPQHGKTEAVTDFISWAAGRKPDAKGIYASFSERLGVRANIKLQRVYDGATYQRIFPETRLNSSNVATVSGQHIRNRELLEYVNFQGYFRNTTVQGSVTGETLDLGVVDDPIKGRKEAQSVTTRNAVWDWLCDDFFTRFSNDAAFLMMLTPWHHDDPSMRIRERFPEIKVVSYPAIAEVDEPHRKAGEPLFPEQKSLEFLLERKNMMSPSSWEGMYQQRPSIAGGDMFRVGKIEIVDALPHTLKSITRYWDKAGTKGGGAYTAGVKMCKTNDGRFIIMDVRRGQWEALERETNIKQTAIMDGRECDAWVEQEPGSGGKESADSTIRNLAGFNARKERVTGDKVLRAEPLAAQVSAGNVVLLRGDWNRAFLSELEMFPSGKYKDQVDAASGAFNKINEHKKVKTWAR